MNLIYLTLKRFNFFSADNSYTLQISESFHEILNNNFTIICLSKDDDQLSGYNYLNLNIGLLKFFPKINYWFPYFYFFFWTPYYLLSRPVKNSDDVFFLGDRVLLLYLIFWRKIFGLKYRICSDWHMYYSSWKEKFVARNSDFLITTSEKLKKMLIERAEVDGNKILAVYGGVDLIKYQEISREEARKRLNLPNDKKIIGYIGQFKTMGMEKGIDTMIRSLEFLPEDYVMIFVGGKIDEIREYENLAEKLKVKEKCLFFERKKISEVIMFEQACDILAIPYPDQPHFRDFGFPMKVYEYMAAKRPIIYSKLELTEEVLSDCAYLFKPDDPKDLADKILEVSSDNQRAKHMTELAYNKLSNFTWDEKAKKIINFIKK